MVPEKWSTEGRIFCYFGLFLALLPPTNPEKQYLKKWEKTHRDIIILHKCAINDIHIMPSSWDKKYDWQNFLSFWAVFCPFTPPPPPPPTNNQKMPGNIILHKCTKYYDHILYCSWDMMCDRSFFILDYFLPFLPLYSPKN